MKHPKYDEVKLLVDNDIAVLLVGPAGSGKTTIIETISKERDMEFYVISMTRQTTLSALIGFKNINGDYTSTELRKAVEFGHLLLIDEIDGGDPNVLLCLNTLENGFMSFPDGVVKKHKNFRLCATANPKEKQYTGRAVLDESTLDRFDNIFIDTDANLEKEIVGATIHDCMNDVRKVLKNWNHQKTISMRDAIRFKKRHDIKLIDGFVEKLLDNEDSMIDKYNTLREVKTFIVQELCPTVEILYKNIMKSQGIFNENTT